MTRRYFIKKNVTFLQIIANKILILIIIHINVTFLLIINFYLCNIFTNFSQFISIDTKDKVIIGPYSRKGKSRIMVESCDHELTNDCLIPFGIFDLKTNQPYFYNFTNKPASEAIFDCIDIIYQINIK